MPAGNSASVGFAEILHFYSGPCVQILALEILASALLAPYDIFIEYGLEVGSRSTPRLMPLGPLIESAGAARHALLARLAVAAWLGELRARARTPSYELRCSMPIEAFAHLIDEIAMASVRLDLTGALTALLEGNGDDSAGPTAGETARFIAWFISRFVETLRPPQMPHGSEDRNGIGLRPSGHFYHLQGLDAREMVLSGSFGERWCDELAAMLAGNFAAQQQGRLLRGGDELSQLLVALSQSSSEVGL